MKLNFLIAGLFVGALIGGFWGHFGLESVEAIFRDHWRVMVATLLAVFASLVVVLLLFDLLTRRLAGRSGRMSESLSSDIAKISTNLREQNVEEASLHIRSALTSLLNNYFAWSLRLSLLRLMLGLAIVASGAFATVILVKQNDKLDAQNALLREQNEAINLQATLQDSSLYRSYAPLVASLVAKLSAAPRNEDGSKTLTPELANEIRAMLAILEPYWFPDFTGTSEADGISAAKDWKYLSREKGQILKALMSNNYTLGEFGDFADFTYSDLRGFEFFGPENVPIGACTDNLVGEDARAIMPWSLSFSDLSRARLWGVRLRLDDTIKVEGLSLMSSIVERGQGGISELDGVSAENTAFTGIDGPRADDFDYRGARITLGFQYGGHPCILLPFEDHDSAGSSAPASLAQYDGLRVGVAIQYYDGATGVVDPDIGLLKIGNEIGTILDETTPQTKSSFVEKVFGVEALGQPLKRSGSNLRQLFEQIEITVSDVTEIHVGQDTATTVWHDIKLKK